MSIDPNTLPEGAVVEANAKGGAALGPMTVRYIVPTDTIARVFVPVPDGMAYADAVAALADAGAWVEVETVDGLPHGARMRNNWRQGDPADDRTYVHRDDLPPTDPDAELVEKMARGVRAAKGYEDPWSDVDEDLRENYRVSARAALAVVREHEATR